MKTKTNDTKTTKKRKPAKRRRFVRARTDNEGSIPHPRKVTIRTTERLSNELASIQGLIFAYGRGETLCDIWERVLMPKLRAYVHPYAVRARNSRRAGRRA